MRLAWVIHYVPDVTATVAFYERAFGVTRRFVTPEGDFAELETGATALAFASEALIGAQGGAFRPHRADEPPAATEIAFVLDDVDAAYARALAAGASAHAAPADKPWGQRVAYVRDPNGVLVELCTAVAPPPPPSAAP